MKIDTSVTIIGIITLTSLVSPWITTKMNNRHQLKMREIERDEFRFINETKHIRSLCENFMQSVSFLMIKEVHNSFDVTPLIEVSKSYYCLLPYLPYEKLGFFKEFMSLIQNESDEDERITSLLREEILPTISKISNRR